MQIRMTATALGADDGFTVRAYEAGQVYPQRGFPVGADLAETFIAAGVAVEHSDTPKPAEPSEPAEPSDTATPAAPAAARRSRKAKA